MGSSAKNPQQDSKQSRKGQRLSPSPPEYSNESTKAAPGYKLETQSQADEHVNPTVHYEDAQEIPLEQGSSPNPPSEKGNITLGLVILFIIAGFLMLITALAVCCYMKRKQKRQQAKVMNFANDEDDKRSSHGKGFKDLTINLLNGSFSNGIFSPGSPGMTPGLNQSQFITYKELQAATSKFSQSNIIGQGGFGFVYRGVLPSGKEIAVKSLKSGSFQGAREFQAEVDIIGRVHHRHLVSLVGFCIQGEKMMLVYDFLPNNTLEYHLHGKDVKPPDWATRLKIAIGAAKGLAYLHEDCHPRIIHRDIKGSNILLDETFEAKVADFGLAKLSEDNITHVSTRVMGTFGYLAPEYASSGKLTEKSDVFSFGVVLLQLITGRHPSDNSNRVEDSLVDWAKPRCAQALEDGNYEELVDPRLEGNYVPDEMACMVACAAAATRHSSRRRPKMSQIVRSLEGDISLEDLNDSTSRAHMRDLSSLGSSSALEASFSSEDIKKYRKAANSSHEFQSGELLIIGAQTNND